ncbi:MAG: hypothetical protein ACR5KV_06720 [Wolbachia sp.]
MHVAVKDGQLDMVTPYEEGADVNAKGKNEYTPLHYATEAAG